MHRRFFPRYIIKNKARRHTRSFGTHIQHLRPSTVMRSLEKGSEVGQAGRRAGGRPQQGPSSTLCRVVNTRFECHLMSVIFDASFIFIIKLSLRLLELFADDKRLGNFPGEVVPAKVAVDRCLLVDGVRQLEISHDDAGSEVEVVFDDLQKLLLRVL